MQPVIGLSPFEGPDVRLVAAIARAGGLGVLDVGRDREAARAALAALARRVASFGVRVPEHAAIGADDLPAEATVVIAPASRAGDPWGGRAVLAQVTSIDEARAAIAAGAQGLVVKGHEAAGRVGDETSFVLAQRVLAEIDAPIWVQGGIGLHTAAACVAAGARGVVLDAQLALLPEASTTEAMRRALAAFDGSETTVVRGVRLYARPNARAASPSDDQAQLLAQLGTDDPARHLVAIGQDAAFAKPLADRFGSVERVVRAIGAAVEAHVRQARALRPLTRGAPLAQALGVDCPIAQGPMTRVSDRVAFAEAVQRGGGLPFLALSLMRGAEVRSLLAEARARLGDRGWGVGVLGFLPPDLREEQLGAILDARPPVALIAGGRPAQAKPLEDAGIPTFLHVPSPGLLDLFWKDGARRFVFEGRECGGHVGPRSSFVLWETAIERLLAKDDAREASVLFAGGVHDARSARMVSVLAAPLAARGAKVGVLMGTAYLFTDEAVASGAITRTFQEAALRCDRTALLETAPGHATRCAESPYVTAFVRERDRLREAGLDAQAAWSALEDLNVGRLRLAAKGLRRDGDRVVAVDDDEQRREGMFMLGQVAALRGARCTIEALHREVCDEATAQLDAIALPEATAPASARRGGVDVAIVGMACIFPDAPDLPTFWRNVVFAHDAVREVPKERWDAARHYDPSGTGEATPSKWGGFLPPTIFDPGAYGIPPRSLAAIDPTQLLALEVAKRALDDAGYGSARPFDRERTSVVFGAEGGTDLGSGYGFRAGWSQHVAGALPPALDDALPKLTEDSFPGVLANVIAGRIANRLDLGGVNYTVDAACASSLAAIDVAAKELAAGTSDMVIAGGADLHNGLHDYLMFASVHALSPSGRCRTFDAKADGITLGEGVAAVVLKRLEDAERDGDRVYAVLKSVGGSSDGKSLGLTAPRKEGQRRALERAYERAGVSPAAVGLVEAHGTGTVVGDRTELATLTEFFGEAGAAPGACTLGSVKSQIGHTKCAAGMAGLIKAALAIHHGVLPPTCQVTTPNAAWDRATSPFVLRDAARPWIDPSRVAGVSAFGFGGTNFHAVLAAHAPEEAPIGVAAWPAEIVVVRGEDDAAARRVLERVEAIAASEAPPALRDLAASVARANAGAPVRFAIVASDLADLRAKAAAARDGRPMDGVHAASPVDGAVALLFPGQGSQRPGMLADLFVVFPWLREVLRLGARWTDRLYPGGAYTPDDKGAQLAALTDTRVAQPALGIVDLATAQLLARLGLAASMTGGHSYGELVALAAAGAFDAASLLALSEARARCILDAAAGDPGTMAAVRAPIARVRDALGDVADAADVTLANHNAPDQVVIAGAKDAIARACARLEAEGIAARPIPVACAFHSPIVAAARETFAARLASIDVRPPRVPVYANATAAPYPSDADEVRRTLAAQLAMPVRFVEQIEAMWAAGARVFVEAGPGGVLGDLVGRILARRPHVVVACDARDRRGALVGLLGAIAKLLACGVRLDVAPLFEGRASSAFDLDAAPSFAAPPTAWIVDGLRARPMRGEAPDFAMKPLAAPVSIAATATSTDDDREQTVREYLRTMREMVEGQRQVMLRFLGETAVAPIRAGAVDAAAATNGARRAANGKANGAHEPARATVLPPAPVKPLDALVATISERTGYPPDMLDPDLDLEADLGIDSIKRIEILGAMRDKLGLRLPSADGDAGGQLVEKLATVKTLRALAARLEEQLAGDAPEAATNGAATSGAAESEPPPSSGSRAAVERYVVELAAVAPAKRNGVTVEGRTFAIVPDALGVASRLAELLAENGARARLVTRDEALGAIDGLLHLESIGAGSPEAVRALFARAQEATRANATWIVAVTGLGGGFGHASDEPREGASGVAGLLKSLAKEAPHARVRAIDVHPHDDPRRLAEHVFGELLADDAHVEVGYANGARRTLSVVPRASSVPPPSPLAIDERSVVLVTGGARGITAQVALAMARRFRCTLELIGRSPIDADDERDGELRAAGDLPALRKLLVERANGAGRVSPATIDAECKRILGAREVKATLSAIREAGGRVEYHAVDVRDDAAFGALLDRVRARHGRVDGVIHGAGLIEDKLLGDKTAESFDRVFSTKVSGAYTLARKLAHDARFFVLFSSVASAFGNRGQTDYAAANDALDKLAHRLHRTVPARVLSINWGPWRGVGMVRPELEREYARRGIGLIAPEDGVERFLDELLGGSEPQVILTAAPPGALSGEP